MKKDDDMNLDKIKSSILDAIRLHIDSLDQNDLAKDHNSLGDRPTPSSDEYSKNISVLPPYGLPRVDTDLYSKNIPASNTRDAVPRVESDLYSKNTPVSSARDAAPRVESDLYSKNTPVSSTRDTAPHIETDLYSKNIPAMEAEDSNKSSQLPDGDDTNKQDK